MDEKRKRIGALGWTVVALALLAAYPLSYGPVAGLHSRGMLPEHAVEALAVFYSPIDWPYNFPQPFRGAFGWYVTLWMP